MPNKKPDHALFYYPYASVTNDQISLLNMVALYFDKLYILDPSAAVAGVPGMGIRPSGIASSLSLLESRGLAERVNPALVLTKYGTAIEHAVNDDLRDDEFLSLCQRSGRVGWELALAKVPGALLQEEAMRKLLRGPYTRQRQGHWDSSESGLNYYEDDVWEETFNDGKVYNESYEENEKNIEYRWAIFKLEAGESILINHALLASLFMKQATPITDDSLHKAVFEHKVRNLRKTLDVPKGAVDEETLRRNSLAYAFLSEQRLKLPSMHKDVPVETVVQFREDHPEELEKAREELYWLARRIAAEPFTPEFHQYLDREAIPQMRDTLKSVETARNSWCTNRRRSRIKVGGLALGVTGTALGFIFAPVIAPVAVIATALTVLGDIGKETPSILEAFQRNPSGELSYFLETPKR